MATNFAIMVKDLIIVFLVLTVIFAVSLVYPQIIFLNKI